MHKMFVLVSAARSGSSLVIESLGKHPQVLAHGEIYHEKDEWHINPLVAGELDLTAKGTSPLVFAKDVLSKNKGHDAVGFKMWRSQSEDACDVILRDRNIIKIILERSNRLAHFSSSVLAGETNVWNVRTESFVDPALREKKIGFNVFGFRDFIEYHDSLFRFYRHQAKGTVLEITYAQAAALDFSDITEALEIAPFNFSHQLHKLHGSNILDRFDASVHSVIRDELGRIGHENWIEEQG